MPLDHLEAAGNYIVDAKPDTIVHLMDHWDMPSLSQYDKGPQGNTHWRGCVMKHEVKEGNYCLMELSLGYLVHNWL